MTSAVQYLYQISINEDFYLEPTNTAELKQVMKEIKNKKSSGIDGISIQIFEKLPHQALDILATTKS